MPRTLRNRVLTISLLVAGAAGAVLGTMPAGSHAASGPAIHTPGDIIWGFVPQGSSVKKTLTITSTGDSAATIKKIDMRGPNPGDFTISNDHCTGVSLPPSATCTIDVTFSPLSVTTRVAHIRFTDTTPCPDWTTLAGTGSNGGAPRKIIARAADCLAEAPGTSVTNTVTNTVTLPGSNTSSSSSANSGRICHSRRKIRLKFRGSKKFRFASASATLQGKKLKLTRLDRRTWRTAIDVNGFLAGRYTVVAKLKRTRGAGTVTIRRGFSTCVPTRKG